MSPELETRQNVNVDEAAIETAYVQEASVIVNPPKSNIL